MTASHPSARRRTAASASSSGTVLTREMWPPFFHDDSAVLTNSWLDLVSCQPPGYWLPAALLAGACAAFLGLRSRWFGRASGLALSLVRRPRLQWGALLASSPALALSTRPPHATKLRSRTIAAANMSR